MEKTAKQRMMERHLDLFEYFAQQMLANPDAAPDRLTIIPLALLAEGTGGLTPGRLALLIEVRSHGTYARMQDLADALGRDKFAVSKDVEVLANLGLVHKRRIGRQVSITPDDGLIVLA